LKHRILTPYQHATRTERIHFGAALDDLVIVPLVVCTLAIINILRVVLLILVRFLDYAFPIVLQIVRPPLFVARMLGNFIYALIYGALRFIPVSEARRKKWRELVRRGWTWLRRKMSYRAFEHAVHNAFENGMAWVFRKCRHLSPNRALLVIFCAVLWLPISLGAATAMHTMLLAHAASWPAWVQLMHPLATIIAKSKLLVLPVYPAAWPQAKRHPFVQFVFKSSKAFKGLYLVRKFGFRYRQTRLAGIAAADRLEQTAGLTSAVRWLRRAHVAKHLGMEKSTEKIRAFFAEWSVKFSAEYYEAKERQAALHQPSPP
jgi:hypothetical protein